MSTRTKRFVGGPLDGQVRPGPLRGRYSIYLDEQTGEHLPTGKATPRKRGYYVHSGAEAEDGLYVHSSVPWYGTSNRPGQTGWHMTVSRHGWMEPISEPVWSDEMRCWTARVMQEEEQAGKWVYVPTGRLVHPTGVEWARSQARAQQ